MQPKGARGFTILELMVTIAVLAILATIAVPAYQSLGRSSAIRAASNDLVAALHFARTQAIKRDREIQICGSDNQTSCTGQWDAGWIIKRVDGAGSRLAVHRVKSTRVDIEFNRQYIVFDPNGFARGHNGTFTIQSDGYGYKTCLIIAQTGRIRNVRGNRDKDCGDLS